MTSSNNSSTPELCEKGVVQTVPAAADHPRGNAELQRALRKVDFRLIPPLAILYLFSYLDRGSLANASIFGIKEDLGLSPSQYNMLVTVFFFVRGEATSSGLQEADSRLTVAWKSREASSCLTSSPSTGSRAFAWHGAS